MYIFLQLKKAKLKNKKKHAKTLRILFGEGKVNLVNDIQARLFITPFHSSDKLCNTQSIGIYVVQTL